MKRTFVYVLIIISIVASNNTIAMMHINAHLNKKMIRVDIDPQKVEMYPQENGVWYSFSTETPSSTENPSKMSRLYIDDQIHKPPIFTNAGPYTYKSGEYQTFENIVKTIAHEEKNSEDNINITKKLTSDMPHSWQELYYFLQATPLWAGSLPQNMPLYSVYVKKTPRTVFGKTPACKCTIDWTDYNADSHRFDVITISVSSINKHTLGKAKLPQKISDILYFMVAAEKAPRYTNQFKFAWDLHHNKPLDENEPYPYGLLAGISSSDIIHSRGEQLTPKETDELEVLAQDLIKTTLSPIPVSGELTHIIETKEDTHWIDFYNSVVHMVNRRFSAYNFETENKAVQLFEVHPIMTQEELAKAKSTQPTEAQTDITKTTAAQPKQTIINPPITPIPTITPIYPLTPKITPSTSATPLIPITSASYSWKQTLQHYISPITRYMHQWWRQPQNRYHAAFFGGLTLSGIGGYLYWKYAGKHK